MKQYKFNSGSYSPKEKGFWAKVLVMASAIIISSLLFKFVSATLFSAVLAAIVISLLNAFLRPILTMISMPFILVSFGLFYLIINAVIVLLTSALIPDFEVHGLGNAILFSIVVTLISYLLELPVKYRRQQPDDDKDKDKETEFSNYEDVTEDDENEKPNV